jgi:hypothetical protein
MTPRKYKVLTEEEIEEIYELYRYSTIAELRDKYGCSNTQMTRIWSMCIHRTRQGIALRKRIPENKYWDTEDDIMNYLDPKYNAEDLKGWELKEYNKLCESL